MSGKKGLLGLFGGAGVGGFLGSFFGIAGGILGTSVAIAATWPLAILGGTVGWLTFRSKKEKEPEWIKFVLPISIFFIGFILFFCLAYGSK